MATDYDTPRKTDEELHEESLEELKAKRVDAQSGQIDVDEAEAAGFLLIHPDWLGAIDYRLVALIDVLD